MADVDLYDRPAQQQNRVPTHIKNTKILWPKLAPKTYGMEPFQPPNQNDIVFYATGGQFNASRNCGFLAHMIRFHFPRWESSPDKKGYIRNVMLPSIGDAYFVKKDGTYETLENDSIAEKLRYKLGYQKRMEKKKRSLDEGDALTLLGDAQTSQIVTPPTPPRFVTAITQDAQNLVIPFGNPGISTTEAAPLLAPLPLHQNQLKKLEEGRAEEFQSDLSEIFEDKGDDGTMLQEVPLADGDTQPNPVVHAPTPLKLTTAITQEAEGLANLAHQPRVSAATMFPTLTSSVPQSMTSREFAQLLNICGCLEARIQQLIQENQYLCQNQLRLHSHLHRLTEKYKEAEDEPLDMSAVFGEQGDGGSSSMQNNTKQC